MMEPTEIERRHGWTRDGLAAYLAERERARDAIVSGDPAYRPPVRPRVANGRYAPHRWRAPAQDRR